MIITLHTWTPADKPALMALCNAVDRTFLSDRLPYPYTEADADWWLGMVTENEGTEGVWRSIWADEQLVGSISVERKDGDENKVGELGYMILTPWWSKGIGTEAVRQMCRIACEQLLEKNGFRLEETKAGAVVKGGERMDVRVYMLV